MRADDVRFALSGPGREALAWVDTLDFGTSSRVASSAAVRARYPETFAALIEFATARRRARDKIRGGEEWLLTGEAVEQATPWQVARLRALRLAGRPVHDATCSVGAELGELTRTCSLVVGSDLDPVRAAMAAHNVPAAHVLVADALVPPTARGNDLVVVADPARRAGGRRLDDPAALSPPLPALLDVLDGADFAVKCAPGLDFDATGHGGEIEVTSVGGGVKEACLWSPGLSAGVRRRATVVHPRGTAPRGGTAHVLDVSSGTEGAPAPATGGEPGWVETITDLDAEAAPPEGEDGAEAGRYIVEPDGAIVRAGLVRHWAARHGLRQLDPRIAHLTGPAIPAGYSGFEVLERHGLDLKVLRKRLRALDCGSLEILVRGVDKNPDALRSSLGLRGSRSMALVVTRIGARAVVFVCAARSRG